eukprot:gene880-biopygen4581
MRYTIRISGPLESHVTCATRRGAVRLRIVGGLLVALHRQLPDPLLPPPQPTTTTNQQQQPTNNNNQQQPTTTTTTTTTNNYQRQRRRRQQQPPPPTDNRQRQQRQHNDNDNNDDNDNNKRQRQCERHRIGACGGMTHSAKCHAQRDGTQRNGSGSAAPIRNTDVL